MEKSQLRNDNKLNKENEVLEKAAQHVAAGDLAKAPRENVGMRF